MQKAFVIAGVLAWGCSAFAEGKAADKAPAKAADKSVDKSADKAADANKPADLVPGVSATAASTAPKPGAETRMIAQFIRSANWAGKLPGKNGGPEVTTKGGMTCKWFANDFWHECEIEDLMGTRQWKAHWVSGWDFAAKEYRGYIFDSYGTSAVMKGRREGNKLTWESVNEMVMRGQPTKLRFTFDNTDPKNVKFTAEHSVNGVFVIDEQETHHGID